MNTSQSSQPQPPPLPEPRSLELDGKAIIKYIDITPASHILQAPTIVLIHGSPGTYNDFRYLVPLLQADARIIGLTLPGFGESEVIAEENYYEHVAPLGGAKLAHEALARLCKDEENVFLVGHSFGGHTTINLTAFNVNDPKLKVRGFVLLASVGHRIPESMWPIGSAVLGTLIQSELPIVSSISSYMARLVYTKLLKFPDTAPTYHYASGMVRSAATDFEVVKDHLQQIAHIPAFVAWAKNDMHLSDEVSQKLSQGCHPGPRFAFERGGHNIQKTKADVLAVEITKWISEICAA